MPNPYDEFNLNQNINEDELSVEELLEQEQRDHENEIDDQLN